jgi:hypothetical protein
MILLPSNIGPPARITLVVRGQPLGPDLTTVAAVTLLVRRSDGTTATWACSIESAVGEELVAQYALQVGDITATGAYELAPQLTIQGGVLPCFTLDLFVSSPFNCRPKYDATTSVATTTAISPDTRSIRTTWKRVTPGASPFNANPLQPWLALDLSTGPVTVNLWPALDGDIVALTDYLGGAATNNATIVAAAGQQVPTSIGHYASATVLSAAGFLARMKYFADSQLWLPAW